MSVSFKETPVVDLHDASENNSEFLLIALEAFITNWWWNVVSFCVN